MKNAVMLLVVLVFVVGCVAPVFAYSGDPCETFLGSILNECIPDQPKEKDTWIYGAGVDVPLWKSEKLIVDQESKIDLNNGFNIDGVSTYTVFKPQMKKGVFQMVGDFVSGILNK